MGLKCSLAIEDIYIVVTEPNCKGILLTATVANLKKNSIKFYSVKSIMSS